ncbi:MAG: CsgG/HfaB family protein, partial [Leptospirales bacterium]
IKAFVAKNFVRVHEVVLLGSMAEFQFQVNHPRYGVGARFSLIDMENATIDCQVQLDLRFVDAGTGIVLWKGTLFSEEEKNVHAAVPGMEFDLSLK